MNKDFKLKGQDLIKGNLPIPDDKHLISTLGTFRMKFDFNYTEIQKLLFSVIFAHIKDPLSYEYKQDSQGIKIQVRADDRHNFLIIMSGGELVWAIYNDEEFWQEQFKSWEYLDEEFKDGLEHFINRFINQNI